MLFRDFIIVAEDLFDRRARGHNELGGGDWVRPEGTESEREQACAAEIRHTEKRPALVHYRALVWHVREMGRTMRTLVVAR